MRLAVIGPQNTGKSTFIEDFLVAFPDYITPGLKYRDIVREHGLSINQETTEKSQRLIRDFLLAQLRENKEKNVIIDRSIIDNYIYTLAQYNAGLISKKFLDETHALMWESFHYLDALLFIPTAVGVELTQDGVRDTDRTYIDYINRLFLDELFSVAKRQVVDIWVTSGDRETRIREVAKKLGR